MVDSSSQTESILETIHKNFEKRKLLVNKVYSSSFRKGIGAITLNRKNLKSLFLESTSNKPTFSSLNKSDEYWSKRIKLNVHDVLFPYKKKHNEILHKSVLKPKPKGNNLTHIGFKKTDTTLPQVHKRVASESKPILKHPVKKSMKSLFGDCNNRRPLFKSISNIKVENNTERSLLSKLQNEKLKELIFI
jgi:hypothetical protein